MKANTSSPLLVAYRFSFLLCLISFFACQDKIGTRDQAIDLIRSSVIDPDTVSGEVMVFLTENALARGDVIEPAGYEELADTLDEKTWFCWIDDEPDAEFAHETRFVFIAARSGEVRVEAQEWYPYLNAVQPLFRDSISLFTNKYLILNTVKE